MPSIFNTYLEKYPSVISVCGVYNIDTSSFIPCLRTRTNRTLFSEPARSFFPPSTISVSLVIVVSIVSSFEFFLHVRFPNILYTDEPLLSRLEQVDVIMSELFSMSPSEKKDDWEPLSPTEIAKLVAESPDLPNTSFIFDESDIENEDENSAIIPLVEEYNAKELIQEINFIDDPLPAGVVHQNEGKGKGSDNDSLQNALLQFTKSVEPIQKGLEEHVRKIQEVVDEHVKPHLEQVQGTVRPHLESVQVAAENFHLLTSQNWQHLSNSTRNLMEGHVQPGLESVKRGTVEGFKTVKQGAVEGIETAKQALIDLPTNSKKTMDEQILPAYEKTKLETLKTIEAISTKSVEGYHTHLQPKMKKAHQVHTAYSTCYMGRAPGLFEEDETRLHMVLAESSLRAFGKVVFCDNPVTGGFIWCAMFLGSPIVAMCSISCVVTLTYIAHYLKLAEELQLKNGDFGVNAVLVGAGTAAFFQFNHPWLGWLGSLIMATFILPPVTLIVYLHCIRSWLFHSTTEAPSMPTLLIPYNLVMVVFLATSVLWDRSLVVSPIDIQEDKVSTNLGMAIMNGISKVFLVEGVLSGLLVLAGTLLCSRVLAGSLALGSVVATVLGWTFGMPPVVLNAGTAGYNAALTTAALVYYFEPSWTLCIVGVFVIVLCGLFEAAFASFFWDAVYVFMIKKVWVFSANYVSYIQYIFLLPTQGPSDYIDTGLLFCYGGCPGVG